MGGGAGGGGAGVTIGMTRLSVTLLTAVCILFFGAACGGDSDQGGALAEWTSEELAEYQAAIDSLSETAGFELIGPAYLPAGTDWQPSTDYIAYSEEAILQFYPLESTGQVFERLVIFIRQDADPSQRHCPPCPDRDSSEFERDRIGDTELVLDEGRSGESAVFLVIYFRQNDIRVVAHFDWQFEPGAPLVVTDDMGAEALKVVQSMIDPE